MGWYEIRGSKNAKSESCLHDELKRWYAEALGGKVEQNVQGFQVDVLKDRAVVEVQVSKLGALRRKVRALSSHGYLVHVVLPIQAVLTSPVRSKVPGRIHFRTCRKKTSFLDAFRELVHFPDVLSIAHVRLELLLLHERRVYPVVRETVWRRGRPRTNLLGALNRDTKIVEVLDRKMIEANTDLLKLLPIGLPSRFSNHDLANLGNTSYALASKITYTLTRAGVLHKAGRQGRRDIYAF